MTNNKTIYTTFLTRTTPVLVFYQSSRHFTVPCVHASHLPHLNHTYPSRTRCHYRLRNPHLGIPVHTTLRSKINNRPRHHCRRHHLGHTIVAPHTSLHCFKIVNILVLWFWSFSTVTFPQSPLCNIHHISVRTLYSDGTILPLEPSAYAEVEMQS